MARRCRKKMDKGLTLIIINYHSVSPIQQLLESVQQSDFDKTLLDIVVVSNSQEKELELLKNNPLVTLVANESNRGFGTACNQALPYCNREYVLLLNPDTILQKDTLQKSLDYISSWRSITVLGIKHLDEKGNVAVSCSRFPSLWRHFFEISGLSKLSPRLFKGASLMYDFDHLHSKYVNQVMGAFMLIRKSYIDDYGFMDERFFVFGEDMDFCKQVWLNKEKVYYNANIALVHHGGSSSGSVGGKKLCYMLEGKLKYAHKYFSPAKWFLLLLMVLLLEPFTRLFWGLLTLNVQKIKETVEGYVLFLQRRQFK